MSIRRFVASSILGFIALTSIAAADELASTVETAWRELLDRGDYRVVMDSYEPVSALYDARGAFDATRCPAQAEALAHALVVNGAGVAVWDAGWRCAEAAGDATLARDRRDRFEALLRHAFESLPPPAGDWPIRVISELDIDVIVESTGMKVLHYYYTFPAQWRWMPVIAVLWDEERQREHVLAFDYIDTWVRLKQHAHPDARYPKFRVDLALAVINSLGKRSGTPAANVFDVMQAGHETTRAATVDTLQRLARGGHYGALLALGATCVEPPDPACAKRYVDVLLPYAEKRESSPLLALARAYRLGAGVQRDDRAIATLLDAADARLGGVRGRILYARKNAGPLGTAALPGAVMAPIEAAARRGDADAQQAWTKATETTRWSPAQRDAALAAAKSGLPEAQWRWSRWLALQHRDDEALEWLERAASADVTDAQVDLAKHYDTRADDTGKQRAAWWYARAAQDGNVDAMRWLYRYHEARGAMPEAARWLDSAAYAGDKGAKLDLARLYLRGLKDVGSPKEAADIYRELGKTADGVQARVELGGLMYSGYGVARDVAGAEQLFRADAAGNADAQLALALLLIHEKDATPARLEEGRALMRKAARTSQIAQDQLASAFWFGRGFAQDRREAARLWQRLVVAGHALGINNYAWALCTSEDDAVVDGAKGYELALRATAGAGVPYGYLDTLAACEAADGDYDSAVRTQQRVIERFQREQPEAPSNVARFRARLELYQSKKRYRERPGGF